MRADFTNCFAIFRRTSEMLELQLRRTKVIFLSSQEIDELQNRMRVFKDRLHKEGFRLVTNHHPGEDEERLLITRQ